VLKPGRQHRQVPPPAQAYWRALWIKTGVAAAPVARWHAPCPLSMSSGRGRSCRPAWV